MSPLKNNFRFEGYVLILVLNVGQVARVQHEDNFRYFKELESRKEKKK